MLGTNACESFFAFVRHPFGGDLRPPCGTVLTVGTSSMNQHNNLPLNTSSVWPTSASINDHGAADGQSERRTSGWAASTGTLSFVVPVKDEEQTIEELSRQIEDAVGSSGPYEIIFIDDGSKDSTWNVIARLSLEKPDRVRGIRFRHNAGKASALTAGFRASRGDIVFTLDGDLQDDPKEIPRFLQKLDEGFDVVSGWKKVRHDPWHKVWPSRFFNRMLSRLSGVSLHDHNCGFKCYRGEVARAMTLHGELHRMIPSLAAMKGYRSAEIEVDHHPRRFGRSKYGIERFLRGFFDMLTIYFLRKFSQRPAHFLGLASLAMFAAGLLAVVFAGLAGVSSAGGFILAIVGAGLVSVSPTVLIAGLVSELLNRGGLAQHWELPICEDTFHGPHRQSINHSAVAHHAKPDGGKFATGIAPVSRFYSRRRLASQPGNPPPSRRGPK
jgi:glycosyltransferase involved in cell wall biosynthesis